MNDHGWIVFVLLFAAFLALFVVVMGGGIGLLVWLNRSKSSAAKKVRRLIGGTPTDLPSAKKFFWLGEEKEYRAKAAQEFAAKRGLRYTATDPALLPLLRDFGILLGKTTARIDHVIRWAENGRDFWLASYTYEVALTDPSTTHTVLYVDLGHAQPAPDSIETDTAIVECSGSTILFRSSDLTTVEAIELFVDDSRRAALGRMKDEG